MPDVPRRSAGRPERAPPEPLRGRRIVVVNWRDLDHPQAGGAERYAWEMATGLVRSGALVTFLTARAPGQQAGETRDGVRIVRGGGTFTVYPRALCWLLIRRSRFDAVVDCQNGIPFFTPWVMPRRTPVCCVIHHVHDKQFGLHFPPYLAALGRALEGPAARWCYRRQHSVAVSRSTAGAMRERLRWRGPIHLIPNGLPARPADAPGPVPGQHRPAANGAPDQGPRRTEPGRSVTVVGRLVAHKRVPRVLDVAARLRGSGVTIHVIGRGPAAAGLAAAVRRRAMGGIVVVHGYLADAAKHALVAASTVHLNFSHGEGWGQCVLEAAAAGVPTVAYDVEGLRDAVLDGETGWLVRDGELIEDVTERALKELQDPLRRARMAAACRAWAACFDWERSAAMLAGLLSAALAPGPRRFRRAPWPPGLAELDGMPGRRSPDRAAAPRGTLSRPGGVAELPATGRAAAALPVPARPDSEPEVRRPG